MTTRFACIADLHGALPDLSRHSFDILLLAGDFSPLRVRNDNKWWRWLDTKFRHWLERVPGQVIAIAGNHDGIFERCRHLIPDDLPWIYLEGSEVAAAGLRIYGSPWVLPCGRWNFTAPEMILSRQLDSIPRPDDVDILLTHGPPHGFCDYVGDEHPHIGSPSLTCWIAHHQPKAVVFGHCHAGRGTDQLGHSLLVNCSHCNEDYHDINPPIFFDYDYAAKQITLVETNP